MKLISAAFALCVIMGASVNAQVGLVERVSVGNFGLQANHASTGCDINADGRYVAFGSGASNLVEGDTNGVSDIFVRDRQLGTTVRVSVSSAGEEANNASYWPSISGDGRLVAFYSAATNLVASDTNACLDVFVHDLLTGITTRVSQSTSNVQGDQDSSEPSLSNNGRYVVFSSMATNLVDDDMRDYEDVFVRDLHTGQTIRASIDFYDEGVGHSGSGTSSISDNGQFVAFATGAPNLGASSNGMAVVRHDVATLENVLASASSSGQPGNSFSGQSSPVCMSLDGRYVVFESRANNLVPNDTNITSDIFFRDVLAGTTSRVSVGTGGYQADRQSHMGSMSGNGRYIVFYSEARNLVPGSTDSDYDIYLHDRLLQTTKLVSVPSNGQHPNEASYRPAMSSDGRFVAFESRATNLTEGDTNGFQDIYIVQVLPRSSDEGFPTRLIADEGLYFSGPQSACAVSDDAYYRLLNDPETLGATLGVETVTAYLVPSSFQFTFESSAGRPGLSREIKFFNFDLARYLSFAGYVAGIGDETNTVVVNNNAASYVSDAGDMRAQVRWLPLNDEDPAQDGWMLRADYAHWFLE